MFLPNHMSMLILAPLERKPPFACYKESFLQPEYSQISLGATNENAYQEWSCGNCG